MNARMRNAVRRLASIAGLALAGAVAAGEPALAQGLVQPGQPASQRQPAQLDAAAVVEGYTVATGDLNQLAAQLQQKFAARGDVRIAADARSRKIVAFAPPAVQREIAAWIAGGAVAAPDAALPPLGPLVNQPPPVAAGKRSLERLVLQHVSWKQFEDQLIGIWGTRLSAATNAGGDAAQFQIKNAGGQTTLEVDRRRGQITIDAPGNTATAWLKVLQAIDAPADQAGDRSQVVPLDNADPAMVMRAVSLIRSAIGQDPLGRNSPRRKNKIGQFVSMIFQQEGAAQPAEAPAPPPPAAGQPAEGQPGAPGAEGQPGAEGAEGAEGAPANENSPLGNVTIDIVGDVIVVRGRKADVERVLKIIEEIERQSLETRPEVELYLLKHVDSASLSEVLTTITPTALSYQGAVTVTALQRPNALLLVGRKENIPALVELIQKLDRPTPPDSRLKVFQLKHMSAIDMERTLRQFFVTRPGQDQNLPTGLGTRVKVIAEFRSNAIIVQAAPRDLAEVAQIIAKLDVDKTESNNEVRIFKLRNSNAEQLAPALQEAITGQGAGGQQQQQQQQQAGGAGGQTSPATATRPAVGLQIMRLGPDGQQLIQSGVLSNMRITADAASNSLLVVGPPSSMGLMAALIEQLDNLSPAEAQIKVFAVANGDATTLTEMLQTLFGQQQGAGAQGPLGLQTATGSGESALVPLRFSVDQRTNSIIVSGNQGDVDVVRNILVRLDVPDLTQRITTVYRLHNAPAADVATAINNLLDRQRDLNQAAPELVTPYQQIEREVLIEPEIVTNSLIVSATPRYFEQIKAIVTELDRRPPMVVIQVLIAEVNLNDDEQFGIEWGLQDSLMFDRSIATNRYGFNNSVLPNDNTPASLATRESVAGQALSNLSVGRIDPTLGFGGLVLTASNESVQVLLRALEASSRAQVISRPQVQTLDNQLAYVNVGALVPRITGGSASTIGTFNPTVSDISVGIILEVTPRTSPDGTIVMQINATKSSVGPEATGIPIFTDAAGNVIRSPQIPLTTAQTTVSARNGQTVILGGLITKTLQESTRRIPYLGDIPVLGRLFRFDSVSEERTELLIIMTPYVIQSEEQSEWINQRETERMSWCIADIVNIHGPVGVSGNPAFNMQPSDVIFPDVEPTSPQPTPATPPLPGLHGLPGLPTDPLLPAPSGGSGLQLPAPPQTSPVTSARRGALEQPAQGRLMQPAILPVAPPLGTQAQFMPQGPPQFLPPSQPWGQGVAPPGPVAPAGYQR